MQLKHLFVFLLVFLHSVAESTFYAQESTSNYYQYSKIIQKKKFNYKNTKHVVLKKDVLSSADFLALFFPSIYLKSAFQKQIKLTLKLQKQLYQNIALLHKQHIFLINKIIASNSISNLYIA
ncbi:hypothetical protein SAMN05216503_0840 [Polaribacter sp. KT25b]|uniref:hypothetical protein n=1 Tax=Polaribacter sp. KT25b TaxID=1855336 RepID=UPI00087D7B52|nr:hypothetical protein [Polaribacter sp. KT25b]SDR77277.1 hypothetical protein SAMN05216503_0840 [Polaribacter sp. KT25b]